MEDYFHHILFLIKGSAEGRPVPSPAFGHKFTKIKVDDPPFPNDMCEKEAKQVGDIHALLVALLAGIDSAGAIVDHAVFDNNITLLQSHLNSKNTKVLKFICNDLKLLPPKPKVPVDQVPRNYKKDWIQCLLEWVSISVLAFTFTNTIPKAKKNKPYQSAGGHIPNLLLLNLCDESKMLSKILQSHLGSI